MASPTVDLVVKNNLVMHDHSEADLGAILDSRYVNVTGDTMTGALVGVQIDVDNLRLDGNTLSSLSGGVTIEPLAGQSLNLSLSTTGDFTINSTDFVWDTSAKKLGIGGVPTYTIDVIGQGGALDGVMRFKNTGTDATNKTGGIIVGHYTNAEEPINLMVVTSQSAQTILAAGGGNASLNTVTDIWLYTAANNTTLSGTLAMAINSSQQVGIGIATSLLARLHVREPTIGNQVVRFQSLTGSGTNPNIFITQARAITTNATPTTLQTIAITASTTYLIEARVSARRTSGAGGTADDGAVYIRRAMVTTKAGVVTINAVQDDLTQEDQAGWDCTLVVSGTDILIRVTGAASNVITWNSTALIQELST